MPLERTAVPGDAGSTTNSLPSSRSAVADLCLLPLSRGSPYPCPSETKKRLIVRASGTESDSENPAAGCRRFFQGANGGRSNRNASRLNKYQMTFNTGPGLMRQRRKLDTFEQDAFGQEALGMKRRGTQPQYSGITARPFRLSMLAFLCLRNGGWRPTIPPSPFRGGVGRVVVSPVSQL